MGETETEEEWVEKEENVNESEQKYRTWKRMRDADEEGTWWGEIFYSILPYSDHLQLAEDYVTVPVEVYLQDVHM